jgi:hypothetical protein
MLKARSAFCIARPYGQVASYRSPMVVLIVVGAVMAAVIACVVYVMVRDRRRSGERARFEASQQGAPYSEESGISQQGNWTGSGSI